MDAIEPPARPKPPVGNYGEIEHGGVLHIVDRVAGVIMCGDIPYFLPGFPIGQRYDFMGYCSGCVHKLVVKTKR